MTSSLDLRAGRGRLRDRGCLDRRVRDCTDIEARGPTQCAHCKASGARTFGGKSLGRFRFTLATSQIALSMLLLVLAALFTQSLANIARVDSGFARSRS